MPSFNLATKRGKGGTSLNALFLVLAFPMIKDLLSDIFPTPEPKNAVIQIGAGGCTYEDNANRVDCNTGGPLPWFTLYDVRGNIIGTNRPAVVDPDVKKSPKGAGPHRDTRRDNKDNKPEPPSVMGGEDSNVFVNTQGIQHEYIRIIASDRNAFCVSFIMTTSAVGNDFRTWNAAFAKQCNAPWYPSPDNFPTMDDYRPNCTWIGTDDRFPKSISIKLTDFSFPGTDNPRATAIAEEIKNNQDYLCNAPGRMMFWKNGDDDACVPSYPPIKRYDNGTAIDPTQILHGHSFNRGCDLKKIGTPWFNYPALMPNKVLPNRAVPLAKPALPAAIDPAIARRWGRERPKTEVERRRVLQARRDHCVENLVISEHADHSARSVCESETSFGPDFVSLYDGSYCDMCERKVYPLCRPSVRDGCFDLSKRELRLDPQQLGGRDLQDMSPLKTYKHVARWSSKQGST